MTYSVESELPALIAQLQRLTRAVRRGEEFSHLPVEPGSGLSELALALNGLIDAVAAREESRKQIVDQNQEVLLALEELARDQASALAEQNEALRVRNEELTRADQIKNEFLATVSHELRTPLSAIIGFAELLLEDGTGALSTDQSEYVTDIHRAGRHLLGMINDILDLARVDAGRLEFRAEPLDLRGPVHEAEEITRSLADQKSIELELQADEEVPCVGDAQRIRQIALNLMSNAVKFTPNGGRVRVIVRRHEDEAELEVTDTGMGIAPEHQQLIFEAFRQVDGSDTRQQKGTGLGLALVKKFAEAMGGSVHVHSAAGEGARFVVRLPAKDGRATAERPRIVLCDRLGPGAALKPTLDALGFQVEVCASEESLAFGAVPQLLVVDLFTPQSALTVLQRAGELAGEPVPALTIVSAEASDAELKPLREAGAQVLRSGAGQAEPLLARLQQVKRAYANRSGGR